MNFNSKTFRIFLKNVDFSLDKTKRNSIELLKHQKKLMDELFLRESNLQNYLKSSPKKYDAICVFFDYITKKRKNILVAKPFYRVRQKKFSLHISSLFKEEKRVELYEFPLNFVFFNLIKKSKLFHDDIEFNRLFNKIVEQRNEICINNIPLAINSCMKSKKSFQNSKLDIEDFIQIYCAALLVAIDKFSKPETEGMSEEQILAEYKRFRDVAIGRMTGDKIAANSSTLVQFFPADKAKLYRALKSISKNKNEMDFERIAKDVNILVKNGNSKTKEPEYYPVPKNKRTNAEEIKKILIANSIVSGDSLVSSGNKDNNITFFDLIASPENEKEETKDLEFIKKLSTENFDILEQKVMKLFGLMEVE